MAADPNTWPHSAVFDINTHVTPILIALAAITLDNATFVDWYLTGVFSLARGLDISECFDHAVTSCSKNVARMLLDKYLDREYQIGASSEPPRTLRQELGSKANRVKLMFEMVMATQIQGCPELDVFRAESDIVEILDIFLRAISANETDPASLVVDEGLPPMMAVAVAARAGKRYLVWELLKGRLQRLCQVSLNGPLEAQAHGPESTTVDGTLTFLEAYCIYSESSDKDLAHGNGAGLFTLVDTLIDPELEDRDDRIRQIIRRLPSHRLKHIVKDVSSLRRLEKLDILIPDQTLIAWLLSMPRGFITPRGTQNTLNPSPATSAVRRQIFRSLAYILAYAEKKTGSPASSSDLASAIGQVVPSGALRGHSGIIRLFLYHGADPLLVDVARSVPHRNRLDVFSSAQPSNDQLYRGLHTDIMQALYWQRWIGKKLIFDLPSEVSSQIMMCLWEEESAKNGVDG